MTPGQLQSRGLQTQLTSPLFEPPLLAPYEGPTFCEG